MRRLAPIALVASAALTTPVMAFDAGGFAQRQHQHQLLRQQTAPNNPAARPPKPQGDKEARIRALQAQHMERLRPKYERRVQRDGRQAADRWLRQEAYRLGREAARTVQSR